MEEAEAELGEVFYLCSFNPSPVEVVTHFLPRLISGEPLPRGAEHLIHRVDIYNHEPKDLAPATASSSRSPNARKGAAPGQRASPAPAPGQSRRQGTSTMNPV
ncbi:hypothetical protein BRADI_1g53656v3 [Brachypodium distachyon]|uniref:NAC domain-containing protein n=1 Tax=Brachypodium distachyon TaxID=15368 RepID=A0A2K2DR93_BRADI|nr:hypothetical protein BRADI_1g53656v3 [Brachypodium distachyon]